MLKSTRININPLAELIQCIFNPANRPVVHVVDILHGGESTDFTDNPGKQPRRLLCVIPANHELVAHLREISLNPFPRLCEGDESGSPILLVQAVWYFQSDVGCLEQVKLNGSTYVALVAKDAAVAIVVLDVAEIPDVMDVCFRQVERVYDAAQATDRVQLISVVINAL